MQITNWEDIVKFNIICSYQVNVIKIIQPVTQADHVRGVLQPKDQR